MTERESILTHDVSEDEQCDYSEVANELQIHFKLLLYGSDQPVLAVFNNYSLAIKGTEYQHVLQIKQHMMRCTFYITLKEVWTNSKYQNIM